MKLLAAIANGLKALITYVRDVFDESTPSSLAHWATAATVATGCWALIHIVRITHALPDPLQLGALAAWMVSPYSINQAAKLFTRRADDHLAEVQAAAAADLRRE